MLIGSVFFFLLAAPFVLWGCWMRAGGAKDEGNAMIILSLSIVTVGYVLGLAFSA